MAITDNYELEKALLHNGVVVECLNDTYADILKADEEIALFMANGIPVIIDVSHIIEADVVKAVKRFCNTTNETGGQLTIIVDVDHPRLNNILSLYQAHNQLTIKVNDKFMQALAAGAKYGGDDTGFVPDSMWKQMSHCNIMFTNIEIETYCRFEASHVNLRDYVTYNRDRATFDFEAFASHCHELQKQSNERAEQYISRLDNSNKTYSPVEKQLVERLRSNVKRNRINFTCAYGCGAMIQSMELDPESHEAQELFNTIDNVCTYKVEIVPASTNGRTLEHKAASLKAWYNHCNELRISRDRMSTQHYMANEEHILKRPRVLEADVVRFQNKKEKWIAFIGLVDGRPYEVFTGIADDDEGIFCPKSVNYGKIIKAVDEHGQKRYDFQFINKRGFKTTIEGLSEKFNPEFWNYAKLISGVLRYGMPIEQVVKLVSSLELDNQSINNWKSGVIKALKRYLPYNDPEL